ncbi:hypothetical protein NEOLEDRAFT_1149978 [Neolentinus lepideus HHB14362 ss-1]|uniref:C2H2-type domain-containing protein n=1 Tax=Neolentinus lepideus HHB14362 ss-1 TaxID=1314782 RepID=A0A165QHF9_9AGAM|nr:hypothetical protein NEOLEDRAFT_1149978 [Neolentinus lepideus HHB14362 ss-1]
MSGFWSLGIIGRHEWSQTFTSRHGQTVEMAGSYHAPVDQRVFEELREAVREAVREAARDRDAMIEHENRRRVETESALVQLHQLQQEKERDVGRWREALMSRDSKIAELETRCTSLGRQLVERDKLLEARTTELQVAQTFLAKTDTRSATEIKNMVSDLNADVFQMAATIADNVDFGRRAEQWRADTTEAHNSVQRWLGRDLAFELGRTDDSSILQIALQAVICCCCNDIVSGWPVNVGEEQVLENTTYQRTYHSIRKYQHQAVAGRWRSLAREHLRRWGTGDQAESQYFLAHAREGIQSVCAATGCVSAAELQDLIHRASHDNLTAIIQLALRLRNTLGEEVTSCDFGTLLYASGHLVDPRCMEDDEGQPLRHNDSPVLCTTELGLIRKEEIDMEDNEAEVSQDVILKARVALVSLLRSSQAQTQTMGRGYARKSKKQGKSPNQNLGAGAALQGVSKSKDNHVTHQSPVRSMGEHIYPATDRSRVVVVEENISQKSKRKMMQNTTLQPPTFACRWDWCRATFSSNKSLVDHVTEDHIKTAKPVKRRELPLIQRAEEGTSGLTDSLLGSTGQSSSQTIDSASAAALFHEPSPVVTIRTPSPSRAYHSPALTPPFSTPPRAVQNQRSPGLTFSHYVTQSSPAVTPSAPSVSESPALTNLVANAINDFSSSVPGRQSRGSPVAKRQASDTSSSSPSMASTPSHAINTDSPAIPNVSGHSVGEIPTSHMAPDSIDFSISTTSSQDVESQLTQGFDVHQIPSQSSSQLQLEGQNVQSPRPAALSPAYQIRTQAWYQSHSHPSSSFAVQSPSHSVHQQKKLQGHIQAHSHPHHPFTFPFRSSNMRISPGPSTHASGEGTSSRPLSALGERHGIIVHHVHHNHRHDHPHSQLMSDESGASTPSQSSTRLHDDEQVTQAVTGNDSQQSLPLHLQLQTQAPYQSQPESQSTNSDRQ